MTKCKREGCDNEIEINPYWSVIGYCSRSCHLKDKKKEMSKKPRREKTVSITIRLPVSVHHRIEALLDSNFPTIEEKASVCCEVGVNVVEEANKIRCS